MYVPRSKAKVGVPGAAGASADRAPKAAAGAVPKQQAHGGDGGGAGGCLLLWFVFVVCGCWCSLWCITL